MVSVCMATYNGEKYIREQIESILSQLSPEDELIISDDGSTDLTLEIVKEIKDSRLKLFENSFRNVIENFQFAINQSQGDYIFLSDQDDVWHPKKVELFLHCFVETEADLVTSNITFIDSFGNVIPGEFYKNGFTCAIAANLKKNHYIGCAMAFSKRAKKWMLPFPKNLPMHDWWIGLIVSKMGKIEYLENKLIFYRRHENNVTTGKKSSRLNIIKWRYIMVKNLL